MVNGLVCKQIINLENNIIQRIRSDMLPVYSSAADELNHVWLAWIKFCPDVLNAEVGWPLSAWAMTKMYLALKLVNNFEEKNGIWIWHEEIINKEIKIILLLLVENSDSFKIEESENGKCSKFGGDVDTKDKKGVSLWLQKNQ